MGVSQVETGQAPGCCAHNSEKKGKVIVNLGGEEILCVSKSGTEIISALLKKKLEGEREWVWQRSPDLIRNRPKQRNSEVA